MEGPDYTAPSYPTKLYSTPPSILTRDLYTAHVCLAFGQLSMYDTLILQCADLLAAGDLDQPCRQIESLFLLSPARIVDGRAQLYSSELFNSYCMAHNLQ